MLGGASLECPRITASPLCVPTLADSASDKSSVLLDVSLHYSPSPDGCAKARNYEPASPNVADRGRSSRVKHCQRRWRFSTEDDTIQRRVPGPCAKNDAQVGLEQWNFAAIRVRNSSPMAQHDRPTQSISRPSRRSAEPRIQFRDRERVHLRSPQEHCRRQDLNLHPHKCGPAPQAGASANSATPRSAANLALSLNHPNCRGALSRQGFDRNSHGHGNRCFAWPSLVRPSLVGRECGCAKGATALAACGAGHVSKLGDSSVGRTFLSAANHCGGQQCPPHLTGTRFAPTLNHAWGSPPPRTDVVVKQRERTRTMTLLHSLRDRGGRLDRADYGSFRLVADYRPGNCSLVPLVRFPWATQALEWNRRPKVSGRGGAAKTDAISRCLKGRSDYSDADRRLRLMIFFVASTLVGDGANDDSRLYRPATAGRNGSG